LAHSQGGPIAVLEALRNIARHLMPPVSPFFTRLRQIA